MDKTGDFFNKEEYGTAPIGGSSSDFSGKGVDTFPDKKELKKIAKATAKEVAKETAKVITKKEIENYFKREGGKGLKKEIKEATEEVTKELVEKSEEKLDRRIDDSRTGTIQALGIFVALFTFISIEFQTFKLFKDNPQAIAGVTLIILGALTFFVVLIDYISSNYNLSFFRKIPGRMQLQMVREIGGYEKDFKLFKASTWGVAFKVKILPLFSFCVLSIIIGTFLLVTSPVIDSEINNKNDRGSKIEIQGPKIEIKDNNLDIPKIIEQP